MINWQPRRIIEQRYAREIYTLLQKAVDPIQATLLNSFEFMHAYAEQAAFRMITALRFDGARTWREAAAKAGKGGLMFRALQQELQGKVGERTRELVKQNAALISSLPSDVAARVAKQAATLEYAGGRARSLEPLIRHVSRTRASLIARTEVSKASTALTQARSENLGLEWYVWTTSQDERVRPSHRKMQGVLIRFDDPPSPERVIGERQAPAPYNAGNIWNCRCYPAPLVRWDEVFWPHKVFIGGQIQMLTLSKFRQLNQKEVAA